MSEANTKQQPAILDARIEAEKLRTRYVDTPSKFAALVIAEKGQGKTSLLRTARLPVHIDSFDPGGTIVLEDMIKKGDIIADTVYEQEDPLAPFAFSEWRRNTEQRIRGKYFESFGTYCLDSSTTWSDCIMYYTQAEAERNDKTGSLRLLGKAPRRNHDYVPQKALIQVWLRRLLTLPCDIIVTGHLYGQYEKRRAEDGTEEDRLTGYRFMSTGKATVVIPLEFSEMWVMVSSRTPTGVNYEIITGRDGYYLGSTRLGNRGKFSIREEANVKKLLKKAGWPTADKPKLY